MKPRRHLPPRGIISLLVFAAVAVRASELSSTDLLGFRVARAEAFAANLLAEPASCVWQPSVPRRRDYTAWAAEVFSPVELADPAVSAPDAVGLADGIANLTKYALALDPREFATAEMLSEAGQLEEHFFLWYRRPSDADDVEYRVEVSTDGVNWSSEGVTQEPILADEWAESWQAHYQAAPGQMAWLRLVVALR